MCLLYLKYKVVNERSDIKSMELYTKCKYPDWDRIVHIKVARADNMSELVADDSVLKLIIVNEGRMTVELLGVKKVVSSPSLICLSDEKVIFSEASDLNLTIVYFRSTEIRDEFSMERIQSGEFEKEMGRIIFQDYLLLTEFISKENANDKIIPINFSAYLKVAKLVENINYNLVEQVDGFWPCRSRSFLMELLYSIKYMRAEDGKVVIEEKNDSDIVGEIIQYMNEHISEKISLQDILKKYSTNRNHLNNIFIQETSMTCLSYLEKMRINLAKIMLSDTELLSAEIAARVGYSDPNYFIKVFKKHTKETPTKYREKNK